jgi:hypothetical protein
MKAFAWSFFILFTVQTGAAATSRAVAESLQAIRAVGPEGQGNAAASAAWKQLSTNDARTLPQILGAMDGANDLALNWLRAAVDSIAARGPILPLADLEKFVRDTRHHPRGRRLAYELIARADTPKAERLLAGMLDDPAGELRRDAVQREIDAAGTLRTNGQPAEAILKYQGAIRYARDVDQIDGIAKALKQLGQPANLNTVFGWITQWKVIGPFDNTTNAGFDMPYPPEQKVDLDAEYEGKTGKVRWQDAQAAGDYGVVDLNKPCGSLKSVTAYAYAEFQSDKSGPAQLRLGSKNGWKVWLNGKYIFGRDEYHRGAEIDQYRMPVELKRGKNTILVKVTQNELVEDWTKEWEFQLRVTDTLGTPLASKRYSIIMCRHVAKLAKRPK